MSAANGRGTGTMILSDDRTAPTIRRWATVSLACAIAFLGLTAGRPVAAASVSVTQISAGTCADAAGIGTVVWGTPTNAQTTNDLYATAALNNNAVSRYLKCTGFGFAIPAGSTIQGITVQWERKGTNSTPPATKVISDSAVRIVKGGAIGSLANKANAAAWPIGDNVMAYGGVADLWGDSWAATDINLNTFGAAISAQSGSNGLIASVDSVAITVTYDPCGNGTIESPEQCDAGAANGTAGSCCSSTCTLRSAATVCRASAGQCDVAETCTGASGACPADVFAANTSACTGA